MHGYMYTPCMAGVCGEQNKALHPQKLKLQMVVSHLLILGTKPTSSARAVSAHNCWDISSLPKNNCLISYFKKNHCNYCMEKIFFWEYHVFAMLPFFLLLLSLSFELYCFAWFSFIMETRMKILTMFLLWATEQCYTTK